jgi:carbon storage regulator CsrA
MKQEGIVINDDILITVTEIHDDHVELAIEHPPEVPVRKREDIRVLEERIEATACSK